MTQLEVLDSLRTHFGDALGPWREMKEGTAYVARTGSYLEIANASVIRDLAFFLRDELDFNNLILISSLDDNDGTLAVTYHAESTRKHYQIAFKVTVSSENAVLPSLTQVWAHANWHEREAWDMMGIRFTGHPDHRRILLEEDYPGHPLRKDFKEPEFYHGMRVPN